MATRRKKPTWSPRELSILHDMSDLVHTVDQLNAQLRDVTTERDALIQQQGPPAGFWEWACVRLAAERDRLRRELTETRQALAHPWSHEVH